MDFLLIVHFWDLTGFSFQIPALGKHYSQRWAQEDLLEEQREGARANDKKKSMMGPLSELDAKGNCDNKEVSWFWLQHWIFCMWFFYPLLLWLDVDALLKKSESQHEPPDDGCPFGPLTQRLLQALVEVSDSSFAKISHYIVQHLVNFVAAQFISVAKSFSRILFHACRRTSYLLWRIPLFQTFQGRMMGPVRHLVVRVKPSGKNINNIKKLLKTVVLTLIDTLNYFVVLCLTVFEYKNTPYANRNVSNQGQVNQYNYIRAS